MKITNVDVLMVTIPVATPRPEQAGRGLDRPRTWVLVKIDTEGFELQVILGARETLENHRPMVLFECNTAPERRPLAEAFRALDYGIYGLNKALFEAPEELIEPEFLADEKTNFIALHSQHPMLRQG